MKAHFHARVPLPLLGLIVIQGACGTLINGSYQKISVRSNPPGAAITIQCKTTEFQERTTPAEIQVRRKAQPCEIVLTKEGYEDVRIELVRKGSQATGWNIAFWGGLGVVSASAIGTNEPIENFRISSPRSPDESGDEFLCIASGFALGGLTIALDYWTGGAYRREPAEIHVTLKPLAPGP